MNDENTPPNSRKRRSQILAAKKQKHVQNSSMSNVNSNNYKSASLVSNDSVSQQMMVDYTSTNRRVSLSELLNCKLSVCNC